MSIIFEYTERKRHISDNSKLINYVMLEGKATAELPLSIMKIDLTHTFWSTLQLSKYAHGKDLIIDARSDYKYNYISINPSLGLYFKLNWIMIKEGLKLIGRFPEKIHFLVYCIKFSALLILSKD